MTIIAEQRSLKSAKPSAVAAPQPYKQASTSLPVVALTRSTLTGVPRLVDREGKGGEEGRDVR